MITCTNNNFGLGEIRFEDYQSESLCILLGKFAIDPTDEDYLAASRLEITLPSDFAIQKSAISNATLISSAASSNKGTVIRCWIENGILCLEKLDAWDEYGEITILLSSAFTVLGYRGTFTVAEYTNLTVSKDFSIGVVRCHANDIYMSLSGYFSKGIYSSDDNGPFCIKMDGMPTDVDTELPLLPHFSSRRTTRPYGSVICIGKIQNGYLSFRFPMEGSSLGGNGFGITGFGLRNSYGGYEQKEGDISLSADDVTPEEEITEDSFRLDMAEGQSMVSLDAIMQTSAEASFFPLVIKEYPAAAEYSMRAPVLARTTLSNYYRVSYHEIQWMKTYDIISFPEYNGKEYKSQEIFGTTVVTEIL